MARQAMMHGRGSDSDNSRDLAHEADMRQLMREQLEADCGGEMSDDEDEYMGDCDVESYNPDEYSEEDGLLYVEDYNV